MDEIDSRPHGDEAATYTPQNMYQPILAWAIFAVLTVVAAVYVMVQGRATEDAITTSGRNAQSASDLTRPIPTPMSSITNFEECVAAGYPVAESFPEQCFTPDGMSFVRDVSADELP